MTPEPDYFYLCLACGGRRRCGRECRPGSAVNRPEYQRGATYESVRRWADDLLTALALLDAAEGRLAEATDLLRSFHVAPLDPASPLLQDAYGKTREWLRAEPAKEPTLKYSSRDRCDCGEHPAICGHGAEPATKTPDPLD